MHSETEVSESEVEDNGQIQPLQPKRKGKVGGGEGQIGDKQEKEAYKFELQYELHKALEKIGRIQVVDLHKKDD